MPADAATIHYPPAVVFLSTGIPVPAQTQWYDRSVIKPSRLDKKPKGSGDHRLVCAGTVYQIGITAACRNLGMPVKQAAEAARLFAVDQPDRPGNTLYPFDRTLLVVKASGTQIIKADCNATLTDICGRPFESAVIVDIGSIVKTIDDVLNSKKEV
jgi:hypothetical protein